MDEQEVPEPAVVQTSIEPNPGAQTKDAARSDSDSGRGHSSLDDVSVRVNVLATILLQTSLFPK